MYVLSRDLSEWAEENHEYTDQGNRPHNQIHNAELSRSYIQDDSKLLLEFPWPIIFKPETTK